MTTRKTARKAGKATAIAIASSCSGCRDNFHLPELHDPAALAAYGRSLAELVHDFAVLVELPVFVENQVKG